MDVSFEELQSEKNFLKKILRMDNEEDVLKEFEKHGRKISHEELMNFRKSVNEIAKSLSKLNDKQLSEISSAGDDENIFRRGYNWITNRSKNNTEVIKTESCQLPNNQWYSVAVQVGTGITNYVTNWFLGNKISKIESQIPEYELKKRNSDMTAVAAQAVAFTAVAGVLLYYGKDFMKWWLSDK